MAKRTRLIRARVVTEGAAAKAALSHDAAKLLGHTEREDFEAAVAAGAVEYTATKFLGRGQYETRRSPDLAGAIAHEQAMGVTRVMVYAINAAGRQTLVRGGGRPIDNTVSPIKAGGAL